jgi:tryptophan 2,3-dioxygenase
MPQDSRTSFGLPLDQIEGALTYGEYLKVPQLTALQELRSDPPQHDETLFIIIHQVYELWFKQIIHELEGTRSRLDADDPLGAHRLLARCIEIERVLIAQIAVLETMTPKDFLAFRDHLTPASGFQSAQFREVEFLSGLKSPAFLENYDPDSPERRRLEGRISEPTLQDAFYALLERHGFRLPADPDPSPEVSVETPEHRQRIHELSRIYEEADAHAPLFHLAESLIQYDELFALWRMRHVLMVERMIGNRPGTGGSPGAAYLRRTAERRFFPDLWELRTHLSQRATY